MIAKLSLLLLSLSITLVLTACGSDNAAGSSANPETSPLTESPTNSPKLEATATPEPTTVPEASIEASPTPVSTKTKETSRPKATPAATAKETPKPTPKPTLKLTEIPKAPDTNSETAQALFKQSCTSCHGVDLAGDFGPNLQKVGGKLTKAQIITQITNGGDVMPSFEKKLKTDEIEALAAWLSAKK